MFDRILPHTLALGLAAVVTLAMLAGVNHMAVPSVDAPAQLAQASSIDTVPVQRVVITGRKVPG